MFSLYKMLYIGSCRYMYNYGWDYFPRDYTQHGDNIFFREHRKY
jgi:hypothetical protein